MKHDLVDKYRLFIHPVVLGSGRRLFADGTTRAALELIGTKITGRGVVAHIYLPSGKPEYATLGPMRSARLLRPSRAS